MAEDGDIDYFVITEPGRLWIARTLLIAALVTVGAAFMATLVTVLARLLT